MNITEFVKETLCEEKGHKLLYLCMFGSHLYGMDTPDSDIDYKGIFLPNKKDLLLGNKVKSLQYSSGNDNDRNTNEDIDVELWSLQYFLELVGKGETGAIDLLYSITYDKCVEYMDPVMYYVFSNPLQLFDPKNCNAFIGYAVGQAKKYGIKGSRLGVIKDVYEYLKRDVIDDSSFQEERLSVIVEDILDQFYDDSYCFMKEVNGEEALVLCGKVHLFSIKIGEFYTRVSKEYERYGNRAKLAEQNQGVDWKALSHAVRCLYQMRELLNTGRIIYPLREREELKKIKNGEYGFNKVQDIILANLDLVDKLQKTSTIYRYKDKNLVRNLILHSYGE